MIAARAAGERAGINARIQAGIAGARRSGFSPTQIAGIIAALRQEHQALLKELADRMANESGALTAAAVANHRSSGPSPRRAHAESSYQRHGSTGHGIRAAPQRIDRAKEFRDAAKTALSAAPAPTNARRRRRGGTGSTGFAISARGLLFRPARVPTEAHAEALAFLSDTLHWLSLWHDTAADDMAADASPPAQNSLCPRP
jgi:hypothetical protein